MDILQGELDEALGEGWGKIHGINEIGFAEGNAEVTEGRSLPWLQDDAEHTVWEEWGVRYRDLLVLDRQNARWGVLNLTNTDLADESNFEAARALFLDAVAVPVANPDAR